MQLAMDSAQAGAEFSLDRVYRYDLWRTWDSTKPFMVVIGLNPSTADETEDDPTIRRCIGFAKREGLGGLHMLNLYAYRSTDPKGLLTHSPIHFDYVGPNNDATIVDRAQRAGLIIAAWGASRQPLPTRPTDVLRQLDRAGVRTRCLGRTKSGEPRHPLYLAAASPLEEL